MSGTSERPHLYAFSCVHEHWGEFAMARFNTRDSMLAYLRKVYEDDSEVPYGYTLHAYDEATETWHRCTPDEAQRIIDGADRRAAA